MKLYYSSDNNEFTLREDDDAIPSASCWVPSKMVSFPFDSDEVTVEYEDEDADMDEDDNYPMVEEQILHIPRHLIYLIQFKHHTLFDCFQPSFTEWLTLNQPAMVPTSFRKVSNL